VIFNGLGTKGVSLAPYFSKVLATWLEKGIPVNKEVDIHRYKHYNYDGNLLR
jgi:glycine/D-amino acid oxidase-like deaminating enzyme